MASRPRLQEAAEERAQLEAKNAASDENTGYWKRNILLIGAEESDNTRPQARKRSVPPSFAHKNKGCGLADVMAALVRKTVTKARKTQVCESCHSRIEPHNRRMANPVNVPLSRIPTPSENIGSLSPSAVKWIVPLSPALLKVHTPMNSPSRVITSPLAASSSMPTRLIGY